MPTLEISDTELDFLIVAVGQYVLEYHYNKVDAQSRFAQEMERRLEEIKNA